MLCWAIAPLNLPLYTTLAVTITVMVIKLCGSELGASMIFAYCILKNVGTQIDREC